MNASGSTRRIVRFGGLLAVKERWGLTWKGWLALLVILVAALGLFLRCGHSFLAVNDPAHGEYLILEGWGPAYCATEAVEIFRAGKYKQVLTCGHPVNADTGEPSSVTYADWGARRLTKAGLPPESIQAVPCGVAKKDRTFTAAMAVKEWFDQKKISPASVDVVSFSCHARRSRLLFQRAFGKDARVGILSVRPRGFDPAYWWRSSAGVRDVLDEWIAYLYAKLFVTLSSA